MLTLCLESESSVVHVESLFIARAMIFRMKHLQHKIRRKSWPAWNNQMLEETNPAECQRHSYRRFLDLDLRKHGIL